MGDCIRAPGLGTPAAHDEQFYFTQQYLSWHLSHPHNLKVIGSNPIPATNFQKGPGLGRSLFCLRQVAACILRAGHRSERQSAGVLLQYRHRSHARVNLAQLAG